MRTILTILLLVACSRFACAESSMNAWTGLGAAGIPVGMTNDGAVRFNWDGTARGPAIGYQPQSFALNSQEADLERIEQELGIGEEDYRRIFITPDPGHVDVDRLVSVTLREGQDFVARIYQLGDLSPQAELNLSRVRHDLFGSEKLNPDNCEYYVTSVARNPSGDLLLKMSFIEPGSFMPEFGVWTGDDYIPIQLGKHNLGASLTGFMVFEHPAVMERIYFGPEGQMLLCHGREGMSFYRPNPATGGYDLLVSHDYHGISALAVQNRNRLYLEIGLLVLLCAVALAVLILLFLHFRRPGRRRRAA